MQVFLEELMSNILRHGGVLQRIAANDPQSPPISITVEAHDRITMTVEDNGAPLTSQRRESIDRLWRVNRRPGIHLIKNFAAI